MNNSFEFLRDMASFADTTNSIPKNKLARIDPDYDPTGFPATLPRVIFDGEKLLTRKRYHALSPYIPEPGDRVLMVPVSTSYIIAGCVQGKEDSFVGRRSGYGYISSSQTLTGDDASEWVDLGTVGPSVTVNLTGTVALVSFSALLSTSVSGLNAYASVAISGASSVSPGFDRMISFDNQGRAADDPVTCGVCMLYDDLSPGVNTFTMKYRKNGSGTARFEHRRLSVVPL